MKNLTQLKEEYIKTLIEHGVSEEESIQTANIFAANAADGVLTHSVRRFPSLIQNIDDGIVIPGRKPVLVSSFSAFEQYDAQQGIGTSTASFAMNRACELAEQYGIGAVGLKNANHWMRAGYYGLLAANNGMVGICWTNTMPNMCAWGSSDVNLGNNPFVMAVPRKNGNHFLLDTSMAQYSYGKLEEYKINGKQLPTDGGSDSRGNLTKNPDEIIKTRHVLPAGYWKGSSMAVLLDAASVFLSNGLCTKEIEQIHGKKETQVCQFFIAINPISQNMDEWEKKAQMIEDSIRPSRYPGERAFYNRQKPFDYS